MPMELSASFPRPKHLISAHWTPVLLRPIFGSPEQMIVAVAAATQNEFHLTRANRLERLKCLYGDDAEVTIIAVNAALNTLSIALSTHGLEALRNYDKLFSGVAIGELREAEGQSVEAIANAWMRTLSSLYQAPAVLAGPERVAEEYAGPREQSSDRLPTLILEYVADKRPGIVSFFSEDIREVKRKRRRSAHKVLIDFSGSKLVANFSTLSSANYVNSVDLIKRRMWDLKVDRDGELGGLSTRTHEMMVQYPTFNDPQISVTQYSRISDALKALEEQADAEDLRFRPLNTVQQIGDHILASEFRN